MTLEPTVIEERLKRLDETIRRLAPLAAMPRDTYVADFRTHWAAERGIQLAAEAVLDIANHILAGHFARFPDTNEQSLDGLLEAQVISAQTRARLRGFGGFRNILVHGYLELDSGQVYDHLQQLPADLHAFIQDVAGWLAGPRRSAD
jgi:uncharacterized protein YutE (UPF0331/DUF86 family)